MMEVVFTATKFDSWIVNLQPQRLPPVTFQQFLQKIRFAFTANIECEVTFS